MSEYVILFHWSSVKDFELLISISTKKIKSKCLALKLKSTSDSSFTLMNNLTNFMKIDAIGNDLSLTDDQCILFMPIINYFGSCA
jgi:hypothetical protein